MRSCVLGCVENRLLRDVTSRQRVDDAHMSRRRGCLRQWCAVYGVVLDLLECRGKIVRIADDAIEMLGIAHLAQKIYTKISGGEWQLVLLARAIAQQPQLLCMDEPTASLDFGNQVLLMNRIHVLSAAGITVIMTTHAPSHAFYCSDVTAVMGWDGVFSVGRTNDIITEARLEKLYGVTAKIIGYADIPETRTCVPLPPQNENISDKFGPIP